MKIIEKLRQIIDIIYNGRQHALAVDLGVNPSTVSRWLDGREIGSEALAKMLKKGININWFLDEDDLDSTNMVTKDNAGQVLLITKIMPAAELKSMMNSEPYSERFKNIKPIKLKVAKQGDEIESINQKLDLILSLLEKKA